MQLTVMTLSKQPPPSLLPVPAQPDDDLSFWLALPTDAFAFWAARERRFEDSTIAVYGCMLRGFVEALASRGKGLDTCGEGDILYFLDSPPKLDRQYRQRYCRFLRDIFDHLGELGLPQENPARKLFMKGDSLKGRNDTRYFLPPDKRAAVMRLAEARTENQSIQKESREYRDAVIVALCLGCGLKAGVLGSITVNCMDAGEWVLEVPSLQRKHAAPILPFARAVLKRWVAGRDGGEKMLPPLSQATVFRSVSAFLVAAGAMDERETRLGPQTLRNTYAAFLIENGASAPDLKIALGLANIESARNVMSEYSSVRRGRVVKRLPSQASRKGLRLKREAQEAQVI